MRSVLKILAITILMNSSMAVAKDTINFKAKSPLGKVNGEVFYIYDWNAEFLNLDEAVKSQGQDALFVLLRNGIIEKMAISKKALDDNIDKSISYESAMRKAKRDILTNLYFEKHMPKKIRTSELKKEYIILKKELVKHEQIRASHILVKSRKNAEKIIKAIQSGADFIALAKSESTGPSAKNGGDLSWFSRGAMVPAFDKVVFSLKNNQLAPKPVKTQFGWHVIKRTGSRAQPVPAFKDVKKLLTTRISQKQFHKIIYKAIKDSEVIIYDENGKEVK